MSIKEIIKSNAGRNLYSLSRSFLSIKSLSSLEGIDHLDGAAQINLSHNKITSLKYLKKNNIILDSVIHLDLSNNNLKTLEGIECFTNLNTLLIFNNKNLMDLKGIQYLKNLKSIDIDGCGFPIDYLGYTINEMKNIELSYERKSKIKKLVM